MVLKNRRNVAEDILEGVVEVVQAVAQNDQLVLRRIFGKARLPDLGVEARDGIRSA